MTLTAGKLNCLDCNSINIGYSLADKSYSFDISSIDIRNQILKSLESKIEAYTEEITELTRDINKLQGNLQTTLATEDVNIESLLMYRADLVSASEADDKIIEIDNKIRQLSESLKHVVSKNESKKDEKLNLYNALITKMRFFYKEIDPLGNLLFELFSKRQSIFSGSEETEFYLSKLYAMLSVINHQFPIVMDYFRGGELSSSKEKKFWNSLVLLRIKLYLLPL
ncbi:hypothetical protein [Gorillibacterium massiliense]|uniref:hypothetical protein n=1 Tax=Gorillibacterium massiliense TaxID=1280390 RepID=UPI0004BC6B3A|nr:hypothetical protein [Gorillibacterium massiliense]